MSACCSTLSLATVSEARPVPIRTRPRAGPSGPTWPDKDPPEEECPFIWGWPIRAVPRILLHSTHVFENGKMLLIAQCSWEALVDGLQRCHLQQLLVYLRSLNKPKQLDKRRRRGRHAQRGGQRKSWHHRSDHSDGDV